MYGGSFEGFCRNTHSLVVIIMGGRRLVYFGTYMTAGRRHGYVRKYVRS